MSKCYRSEVVGVFGCPIDENPTGVVEEAAFAAKGLDFRYLTLLVRPGELESAMAGMKAMNFRGINLTIPHKVEVLKYLDELSPAAEIIGAVNVVVNRDGRLWGDNTDGKGFLKSLTDLGIGVQGRHVAVLGAGGAARAICVECALAGAKKITVVNRTRERGEALAVLVNEKTPAQAVYAPWDEPWRVPEDADILVNGTSIGLYPDCDRKPRLDYDTVRPALVASDVVFNDPNTLFLRECAAHGARVVNGLGMLVNQAAVNFRHWTGEDAPVALMTDVLKKEFNLA